MNATQVLFIEGFHQVVHFPVQCLLIPASLLFSRKQTHAGRANQVSADNEHVP